MRIIGPNDREIEEFLLETQAKDAEELEEILESMRETISETEANEEPLIFAYGKLWNFLKGNELSNAMKQKLLSAAIWRLVKDERPAQS